MKNVFYVYVYEDVDGVPFYIGKGHGNRIDHHINDALKSTKSTHKLNKIRKIIRSGSEPIRTKLVENLSEEEAFQIENELILSIGRKDLGTGPLLNMTDGGEGSSGLKHSEEWCKNKSNEQKEVWKSDERKTTHQKMLKKRWSNDEFKKKWIESRKEYKHSYEVKEHLKKKAHENREIISKNSKVNWSNPDYVAKQMKSREKQRIAVRINGVDYPTIKSAKEALNIGYHKVMRLNER